MSAKAQETGAEFLSDLHDFRVNNYLALDAFYNFSATGDTETLNRIVVGINNSNDAMNSVVASTSGVLSEQAVLFSRSDWNRQTGWHRNDRSAIEASWWVTVR